MDNMQNIKKNLKEINALISSDSDFDKETSKEIKKNLYKIASILKISMSDKENSKIEEMIDQGKTDEEIISEMTKICESSDWERVEVKDVYDFDGFKTQYAMYVNPEHDKWIFMFGDTDLVEPDEGYADWTEDSEKAVYEWFNNFIGYEE